MQTVLAGRKTNMKLVKLTDFWNPKKKEYLDPSSIARIEHYSDDIYKEVSKYKNTWFGKVLKVCKEKSETRNGSKIYMKTAGDNTCVLESPEQVVKLIKGEKNG